MKKIFLLMMMLGMGGMAYAAPASIEALTHKPLPDFHPPTIQTHVFPNGIRLYFLEDHELPLVEVNTMVTMGAVDDPAGKVGLASMLVSVMRTGGSALYTGDELDRLLEQKAIILTSDAGREISHWKVNSLSNQIEESLKFSFEVLLHPRLDPAKIEVVRRHFLDDIRRRNEDPEDVAQRKFPQMLYGISSVWARVPTLESVSSITQSDLEKFYQAHIVPENLWVAVSGDITFDRAVALVEGLTHDLPAGKATPRQIAPIEKKWEPGLVIIPKEGNQSTLVLGHFGEKRFNPDKYALILANQIFGGSTFVSRLGNRVRTSLGLAYSVFSSFGFDTDYGLFEVVAATKSETTAQVIQEAQKILIDMMGAHPLTEDELQIAKDSLLNQLIFQYDDSSDVLDFRMRYDYYGYPPDYLTLFQKEVQKVTLGQVQDALKRYFFPDRFKIVVVGDVKRMGDLKAFGPVKILPLDGQ